MVHRGLICRLPFLSRYKAWYQCLRTLFCLHSFLYRLVFGQRRVIKSTVLISALFLPTTWCINDQGPSKLRIGLCPGIGVYERLPPYVGLNGPLGVVRLPGVTHLWSSKEVAVVLQVLGVVSLLQVVLSKSLAIDPGPWPVVLPPLGCIVKG